MRTLMLALSFLLVTLTGANAAALVARIDLSSQSMTVIKNGAVLYNWPVSTGRKGYGTPTGTYTAKWLSRHHWSKKYDAPMPHAIFFRGGYAIHGTNHVKRLGRVASHGCVRLAPGNAAKLFSLVSSVGTRNMKVVITR